VSTAGITEAYDPAFVTFGLNAFNALGQAQTVVVGGVNLP
jgi:hypothetical protein